MVKFKPLKSLKICSKLADTPALQAIVGQEDQLNEGQRAIFDEIIQAANDPDQDNKLFFIDGPWGTGKSTLLRRILAKVCLAGKIAIAVASSGIASLLLMGGRTAHSTFKIPLKLTNKSICAIYKHSHLKRLIQRASLIIWDEALMTHRHTFKAVDRTLRDIMDNDQEPFGGKVDADSEKNFFEQEVLHSISINGIPPYKLTLKKGALIMMMRNLNPDLGLCNGTRLRIVELKPHFPVVPALAMTINKAQGQTVQNLGLYLTTPCFSHGQLYVALSRITSGSKFKALIEYPELEEDDGVYTDNNV
ncbi:unnamed protein product [Phytophthora fragariaefolia]|uniref:ATP-dependent DNA helicase n=1 Tax=Phytophthora fragariaefolia TaxID=1490495 RepID=A0A9W6TNE7_9STRA|nr:unnamed protein product [Phytophthora fragariaefolia]